MKRPIVHSYIEDGEVLFRILGNRTDISHKNEHELESQVTEWSITLGIWDDIVSFVVRKAGEVEVMFKKSIFVYELEWNP